MRFLALLIIAIVCFSHAYEHECGTLNIIKNRTQYKQEHYASLLYKSPGCSYEQYYDSVYSIETPHIQVFYVLNGPHATTKAFADSTAASMEDAWNFYVNKLKMLAPKGLSVTHHFQQPVKNGLYPIEILDIAQLRDPYSLYACSSCYGLTIQPDDYSTALFLENDFLVGAAQSNVFDTLYTENDTCVYPVSKNPLRNSAHNYSYADEWAKGIRLTVFHEFYHAVQLRYINIITDNFLFWFEASATGFEEIINSDIDDYISYIPHLFNDMGQPFTRITRTNSHKIYGISTLFLYLYHKISNGIDKSIWESISKNPNKSFEYQLDAVLKPMQLNADSVFHDYTVSLSLSGEKSSSISQKYWIIKDQPKWPSAIFYNEDSIKPELESLSFKYYRAPNNYTEPDFSDFVGKASVITFNKGKASVHKIQNTKTLDSLTSILSASDSILWIFSRFGDSESIPIVNKDAAPHAYPVPWREGSLCFAPLPSDKKFFEIRNRRGDLVSQIKYEGTSHCLQEHQVKEMMAPGVYRFRVGNKGKTKSFMVIY